jgi:hypothetical protein
MLKLRFCVGQTHCIQRMVSRQAIRWAQELDPEELMAAAEKVASQQTGPCLLLQLIHPAIALEVVVPMRDEPAAPAQPSRSSNTHTHTKPIPPACAADGASEGDGAADAAGQGMSRSKASLLVGCCVWANHPHSFCETCMYSLKEMQSL